LIFGFVSDFDIRISDLLGGTLRYSIDRFTCFEELE